MGNKKTKQKKIESVTLGAREVGTQTTPSLERPEKTNERREVDDLSIPQEIPLSHEDTYESLDFDIATLLDELSKPLENFNNDQKTPPRQQAIKNPPQQIPYVASTEAIKKQFEESALTTPPRQVMQNKDQTEPGSPSRPRKPANTSSSKMQVDSPDSSTGLTPLLRAARIQPPENSSDIDMRYSPRQETRGRSDFYGRFWQNLDTRRHEQEERLRQTTRGKKDPGKKSNITKRRKTIVQAFRVGTNP